MVVLPVGLFTLSGLSLLVVAATAIADMVFFSSRARMFPLENKVRFGIPAGKVLELRHRHLDICMGELL